jgi:hypothetical protein
LRAFALVGAAAVPVIALMASPALASKPVNTSSQPIGFETVAGRFRVHAKANTRVARLANKGVSGFVVEAEGGRFEVERPYDTRAAAKTEAKKVRRIRYASHVESDSAGKP